ncbi:MAG: hypothetical protein IPI79_09845 [Moraxellaceae bacterium]|nr:hypothetical protein [Moraxellaceae bacterium]
MNIIIIELKQQHDYLYHSALPLVLTMAYLAHNTKTLAKLWVTLWFLGVMAYLPIN